MKKRRTLIIALLLIAALALGIGYAEFTSKMSINGEVQMNGTVSQVIFSKAEVNSEESTAEVVTTKILGVGSKTLEISMSGFEHIGHKVVIDIEVKNPHDFDVTLINSKLEQDGVTNPDGAKCFDIQVVGADLAATPVVEKNNGVIAFQIVVTCTATSPKALTENFTISFDAHAE